jgi:hypothetical protein
MFRRSIACFIVLLALGATAFAQAPSEVHLVQGVVHGIRSDALGRALDADLRALEGVLVCRFDRNNRNLYVEVGADSPMDEQSVRDVVETHGGTLTCYQRLPFGAQPFRLLDPRLCTQAPAVR